MNHRTGLGEGRRPAEFDGPGWTASPLSGNLSKMLNSRAHRLFEAAWTEAASLRIDTHTSGGAQVLDAGCQVPGSLGAGIMLAKLCLAGQAEVSIVPRSVEAAGPDFGSTADVFVQTDAPLTACLGGQYAGWPVSAGDYFAMASGPMRMLRGREEMLLHLGLIEEGNRAVGVLESGSLPSKEVIEDIASQCGVEADGVAIAVAPSTSIAGSVQVVARSIETAMHKLHALQFDVRTIVSAIGSAPLPPPAKPGHTIAGIGRTNDAILYGARVTFWVDADDEAIEAVIERVPSVSSKDYGRPFAEIFKDYGYDFYQVDPMLFSPAIVSMQNLRSGRVWQSGRLNPAVLHQSFLS